MCLEDCDDNCYCTQAVIHTDEIAKSHEASDDQDPRSSELAMDSDEDDKPPSFAGFEQLHSNEWAQAMYSDEDDKTSPFADFELFYSSECAQEYGERGEESGGERADQSRVPDVVGGEVKDMLHTHTAAKRKPKDTSPKAGKRSKLTDEIVTKASCGGVTEWVEGFFGRGKTKTNAKYVAMLLMAIHKFDIEVTNGDYMVPLRRLEEFAPKTFYDNMRSMRKAVKASMRKAVKANAPEKVHLLDLLNLLKHMIIMVLDDDGQWCKLPRDERSGKGKEYARKYASIRVPEALYEAAKPEFIRQISCRISHS